MKFQLNQTDNAPGKIARGIISLSFALFAFSLTACGGDDEPTPEPEPPIVSTSEATKTLTVLWESSSYTKNSATRLDLYDKIQGWADACPSDLVYSKYLISDNTTASALEKSYPILECYNLAFERVLTALKAGKPSDGRTHVWNLYNMGIVVQTPEGNYAIDIYHRRGVELVPYIDFYAITHIHADHKWEALAREMSNAGKPVLTNFAIEGVDNSKYLATEMRDYTIGKFNIHSFITHHNSSPISSLAITAFYVSGGGINLLHSGDSNFIAEEFESMRNKEVDCYVFRYAVNALTENNVLGNVVNPKVAILSHMLELGHKDVANSRWSLQLGLDRASRLNNDNVAMPFWGDCIIL